MIEKPGQNFDWIHEGIKLYKWDPFVLYELKAGVTEKIRYNLILSTNEIYLLSLPFRADEVLVLCLLLEAYINAALYLAARLLLIHTSGFYYAMKVQRSESLVKHSTSASQTRKFGSLITCLRVPLFLYTCCSGGSRGSIGAEAAAAAIRVA